MSDNIEKIGKIDKVGSKVQPSDEIETVGKQVEPNKDYFDALMQQSREVNKDVALKDQQDSAKKAGFIDELKDVDARLKSLDSISPQQVIAQVQNTIQQIDDIKKAMETPNLKIQNSIKKMMNNKLSHIDDSLRIALTKADLEYEKPAKDHPDRVNPVKNFLGYLTDGQNQLHNLSKEIESMSVRGEEFNPLNMLAVQVKVSYVQQELEFFTNLLNKALESTKTIMNVQV